MSILGSWISLRLRKCILLIYVLSVLILFSRDSSHLVLKNILMGDRKDCMTDIGYPFDILFSYLIILKWTTEVEFILFFYLFKRA